METTENYGGTGRRKRAVARVKIVPGTGVITINNRVADEYFPRPSLMQIVRQSLEVTETASRFDVHVKTAGGGVAGQAGAVRHGIARALVEFEEVRPQARPQTLPVLQALKSASDGTTKTRLALTRGSCFLRAGRSRGRSRVRCGL